VFLGETKQTLLRTLGELIQNLVPILNSWLAQLGGQVVLRALENRASVDRSQKTLIKPDAQLPIVDGKTGIQLLIMAVALDRPRIPSELFTHVSKFGFRPIDFGGGQDRP